MRTADLIGARVFDSTGRGIGKVHDLRATRSDDGREDATYVVTHLLVAAGTVGTRLGYGYSQMHGPWPISTLIRRALHSGFAVRWEQIASIEPKRRLLLNVTREELARADEVLDTEGGE